MMSRYIDRSHIGAGLAVYLAQLCVPAPNCSFFFDQIHTWIRDNDIRRLSFFHHGPFLVVI